MNISNIRFLKIGAVLTALLFTATTLKAQLDPLAGLYFQNQYLGNPAMAGVNKGLDLNMSYRKQWTSMPGAPETQALTGDFGTGKKVGLGFNIHNDEAGLIKRTRVLGTYAYHLPLNKEGQRLSMGLSLGFMNERVMDESISGNPNDLSVRRFNQRVLYVDGDFGVAYTNSKLTVQAALPNMKSFFQKDDANGAANLAVFFSAISYEFSFPNALNGLAVEPKVAWRGINGFDDILDVGANVSVANKAFNVMGVYHSTESLTLGLGAVVKSFGGIYANYTTATSALAGYSDGNFELGMRLNLFQAKK
jgi:type IX secretion system PorP/SprF family membrane protein